MKALILLLIISGAVIMLFSILKYYKSLVYLKIAAYEQKVFANWIYMLCLVMMIFFLGGYVLTGVIYALQPASGGNLLVASIFFFGALFVFVMVSIERRMSNTISRKTGEIVRTLVNAVEAKGTYTRGHSDHVLNLVKLFYAKLPDDLKEKINLPWLMDAAILHDIGKIGIDDSVLNKPGALDEGEWELIKSHPELGKKILENTSYNAIGNIIRYHHERIDGAGYYGKSESEFSLESKIIAIADTFSAICTDRVYRKKRGYEEACAILKQAAGTQLDARLVEIFCQISPKEFDTAGFVFSEQISYLQ